MDLDQDAVTQDPDKAILKLPFEDIVMTHIAPLLEKADLYNMRLTSKTFAYLANRIIEESSSFHMDCCGAPTSKLALLYCQNLRIIHLCYSRRLTDDIMIDLISRNPHIVEFKVSITSITYNGIYPILNCQNLTILRISNMTIPDKFLKALARSSVSLQHVTFWNVKGFLGNSLAFFFSNQPHLKSIVLSFLHAFVRSSLQVIGRVCHQLEEISVLHCIMVDDQGVLSIARNCPRLHTLRLTMYDDMSYTRRLGPHTRYAQVSYDTVKFLEHKNIKVPNFQEYFSSLNFLH